MIASEDWKGMREDFKMFSEVVQYKLDHTPTFVNPPLVKERKQYRSPEEEREADRAERRRQLQEQRRRERLRKQQQSNGYDVMAADDADDDLIVEPTPGEQKNP